MKTTTRIIAVFAMTVSALTWSTEMCGAQEASVQDLTPAEAVAVALSANNESGRSGPSERKHIIDLEPSTDELLVQGFWYARNLVFDTERIEETMDTDVPALVERLRAHRAEAEPQNSNRAVSDANPGSMPTVAVGETDASRIDAAPGESSSAPIHPPVGVEEHEGVAGTEANAETVGEAPRGEEGVVEPEEESAAAYATQAEEDALLHSAVALESYVRALDSLVDLVNSRGRHCHAEDWIDIHLRCGKRGKMKPKQKPIAGDSQCPPAVGRETRNMLGQLTIPSAIAYGVLLCLLTISLSNLFEVRARKRALLGEASMLSHLSGRLAELLKCRAHGMTSKEASYRLLKTVNNTSSPHPAVTVLRNAAKQPEIAHSRFALDSYLSQALDETLGSLMRRIQLVAGTAPYVGLMGTLIGFATATIILSKTNDQRQMLAALAVALGTTFLGSVVSLIEKFNETSVHHLEESLELDVMPFMSWGSTLFDPYYDALMESGLERQKARASTPDEPLQAKKQPGPQPAPDNGRREQVNA